MLAQLPLQALTVSGFYRPAELPYDADSPTLRELFGTDALVEPFAACPHLMRLRELELSCHMVGDPATGTLLRSPLLEALRSRRLSLGCQTSRWGERVDIGEYER